MSLDKLKEKLKNKTPDGVYAFYGDEEYTKSFYLKKLLDYAEKSPAPEFNTVLFNDETITADALRDAIDTPPFMCEYKAIVVNGLPLANKSLINELCEICGDTAPGIILIFSLRAGDVDCAAYNKKKDKGAYVPLLDSVSEYGICVEFSKESGAKLYNWIGKHFAASGVTASQEAIEFLPAYCGNEMTVLHSEISKLCSYCKSGQTVTAADVEFVCCPNYDYQFFELAASVVEKNFSKTRSIMQNFAFNNVAPEIIMGTVAKNFCDMLYVKSSFIEKKDAVTSRNAISMPDWLYKRTLASTSKVSIATLRRIVAACDKADKKLKSYSGDQYTQLELLFCEIDKK